jgi:hypothetical protein
MKKLILGFVSLMLAVASWTVFAEEDVSSDVGEATTATVNATGDAVGDTVEVTGDAVSGVGDAVSDTGGAIDETTE